MSKSEFKRIGAQKGYPDRLEVGGHVYIKAPKWQEAMPDSLPAGKYNLPDLDKCYNHEVWVEYQSGEISLLVDDMVEKLIHDDRPKFKVVRWCYQIVPPQE